MRRFKIHWFHWPTYKITIFPLVLNSLIVMINLNFFQYLDLSLYYLYQDYMHNMIIVQFVEILLIEIRGKKQMATCLILIHRFSSWNFALNWVFYCFIMHCKICHRLKINRIHVKYYSPLVNFVFITSGVKIYW